MARGAPHRPPGRAAVQHHDHVRDHRGARPLGPPSAADRALQRETGGFTEFVPLPFVHMAAPIYLERRARRGPTFREALLLHAVGRIAYHGVIDNIQGSWVKLGLPGMAQVLQAGVNDLGGTLMGENISRAAGARHGQEITEDEFRSLVDPLSRPLEQRTTLYARVSSRRPGRAARGTGHRLPRRCRRCRSHPACRPTSRRRGDGARCRRPRRGRRRGRRGREGR